MPCKGDPGIKAKPALAFISVFLQKAENLGFGKSTDWCFDTVWGRHSPTSSDRGKNSAISNFGPRVDTCSKYLTASSAQLFSRFAFQTRFKFCKIDKNEGRHQAKDHVQFSLLRDSFLDLIPALCFHIHPAYPQDSDERLKAESRFPQRSLSRWGLYHARSKMHG